MKKIAIEYRVAVGMSAIACLVATLLWLDGHSYFGFGYYVGDKVYKIGSPITAVAMSWYVEHHGILKQEDDYWAIPAMNLLFTSQMLIWASLIYGVRRLITKQKHEQPA
jgi:hypothetical protein